MYYTPQTIVDQINGVTFDPAAGSGGLLAAVVRNLTHPLLSNPPFSAGPAFQDSDADVPTSTDDVGDDNR